MNYYNTNNEDNINVKSNKGLYIDQVPDSPEADLKRLFNPAMVVEDTVPRQTSEQWGDLTQLLDKFQTIFSQKKYLHIVLDHATRYAWTFPSKSVTSETYTICLKQIFSIQCPKQLLSDRNAAFTSSKFKKFLKHHNIRQLLTSANRPQCNGNNERVNQTLVAKLRCKVNSTTKTPWTKLLEQVTYEYNNSPHDVTGFPPAYLMFGTLPYDSPLPNQVKLNYPPIQQARQIAINRTIKHHKINKQRNWGVEIEVVSPSIVPSGNFAELNRTVTCMVLKANDRRTSCPCHDEFRGPRSDYVRQKFLYGVDSENPNSKSKHLMISSSNYTLLGGIVGLSLAFCIKGHVFDPGPSRWIFMMQEINNGHAV
ncbi:retrotransposable element Tf2 protein type 3 [Trichonephila clavipes]|nr:retrotransposable element Tf2 protein type 3 [Trichonephila clavipes]